jgi:predicted Rossmann fold flavoprotein
MQNSIFDSLVVGAGAAGCFAAITIKSFNPQKQVAILEKSARPLAKVKISGGGRCNVTNACFVPKELAKQYPRGSNFLKKGFGTFGPKEMMNWLEERGVSLHTYPDGCVFPQSNSSQTIIDCFLGEMDRFDISLNLQSPVKRMTHDGGVFEVHTPERIWRANNVIIATGGQPKRSGLSWIEELGHPIMEPVPSLFTFNMPGNPVTSLMGTVIETATAKIAGSKLRADGPLLITHWGMSGPAILKLSAWGAREIAEKNYHFQLLINWLSLSDQETLGLLRQELSKHPLKQVDKIYLPGITQRLWTFLVEKSGISVKQTASSLSERQMNKIVQTLCNDAYTVNGKTTYKEEFVTAGGVDLSEVNPQTMESKRINGLYFTGEILDVDGITGGFNFQAAWTSAFLAGKNIAVKG